MRVCISYPRLKALAKGCESSGEQRALFSLPAGTLRVSDEPVPPEGFEYGL